MPKSTYVKASEIGDFVYCKRGWWLKFNDIHLGDDNDALRLGNLAHSALGRSAKFYRMVKEFATRLILLGITFLMFWLLFQWIR